VYNRVVMNLLWAVILGGVQGLTEFFPVSSTAHLVLFPWMFKFSDPGLSFDIALHTGTFLAILFALKNDWISLAKSIFDKKMTFEKKLIGLLLLTSIPGAIFGYLLEDKAGTVFREPMIIAGTLVFFGVVLWGVDKMIKKQEKIEKMNASSAFLVGISQAIAIIPGVSRSGATIAAGRALGFSREAAVKYSFMAALPIIFGATVFGLRNVNVAEIISTNWVLGFVASLIFSFFAIKFLLYYVKKYDFSIFLYYRIALAFIVILLIFFKG